MIDHLYNFTGDNIVPRERITLAIEMGTASLVAHHFIEFLVIVHRSVYHDVLGRPTLK